MSAIFPEEMLSQQQLTLETIAAKLTYFTEQFHLIHWQTASYAEHKAVGDMYEYLEGFKDDVIEKLMGYTGRKPKAYKFIPLVDLSLSTQLGQELKQWAASLKSFAETNSYLDIGNMADDLSGKAAKLLYLLTLS